MNGMISKASLALTAMALVLASCASDDSDLDQGGYYNGGQGGSGSTAADFGELTAFAIAIDESNLEETETIDPEDEDYVENNSFGQTVSITFSGNSAAVGTLPDGITATVDGADVVVNSTVGGVNYVVSGSTTDGMLKIYSEKKYQLTLNGIDITNLDGPAVNLQSGKRCYVVLTDGTVNTLTDGTSYAESEEDQKGALFSEGELLFSGSGKLRVYGNTKHGIASDDYILFRPGNNVYVHSTAGNCIKANDGIFVRGGVINVETSATAAKGLSSDADIVVSGGRITAITTGNGEYDTDEQDCSGAAGMKADGSLTISGGAVYCKSTGSGGKGINVDGEATLSGGTVRVITTGGTFTYGSTDSKPKGIKVDGNLYLSGADIMVRTTGDSGSEGIESKAEMHITGGTVQVYAYDDALNTASHLYAAGGTVLAYSVNNDGIDTNGNLYMQGGNVVAYGMKSPECGIDANEEEGYTVVFEGGNLMAIGAGNSQPSSSSGSTQGFISTQASFGAGITATVSDGSTTLATFSLPAAASGASVLVTASGMKAGSKYTLALGSASASLTASQYGTGGMNQGPGGQGGNPGMPPGF